MAERNVKQIADKLNAEFTGNTRKLVFWYDDKAEFADDIHTLELANAKVYQLEPDNQFYTKYFLERLDRTTNYLIYAPFPQPPVRDNHLADTIKYSKTFFADRAALLAVDLGISERYKPVIQKYIKFFGAKDRTQRFYELEVDLFTEETIEIALMSVLCKTRTASFEEVVRVVLTDGDLNENKLLGEFAKYELLAAFWRFCEEQFGYADENPTLGKLVATLFVTYTERYMDAELPKPWKPFVSFKAGNCIAFLDHLMNSVLYRGKYDELSEYVAAGLNAANVLDAMGPEALLRCDTFACMDQMMVRWITDRLLAEDTGAKLNGMTIPHLCRERSNLHFGEVHKEQYQLLEHAYYLLLETNYTCPDDMLGIVGQYREADCLMDTRYRCFYACYDKLADRSAALEQLRDLIENIYTNDYLDKLLPKWNAAMMKEEAMAALPLQRNFYSRYIRNSKERVVVIISDAMRYETGRSLWARLQEDEKCSAKLDMMLSVLPSYTRLGMAALLPNKALEMTEDYRVLVDGFACDDLKHREAVLQRANPNSRCIPYDDMKMMKRDAIRQLFAGMDVIYIYHNQIDARGDKPNTENEVFVACEEAVNEIYDLIKQLTDHVSATHYIVTADHGFLYKRDKLQESDKIASGAEKGSFINRRFIVSDKGMEGDGIGFIPLGRILGNHDTRAVSFPISSNVFKVAGGGQNYVHGGSSPQEMIVPVLDIKTEKGHKETRTVEIKLISMIHKISSLVVTLDFIQHEPVSDMVKGTSYRLYFVSGDEEKISNENMYIADKKETEPQNRMFRLRFSFKNKTYDKSKRYYLVAYDEKHEREIFRHDVMMDIYSV